MQELFIHPGELLLPADGVNPTAWACIACDQFTSQPEYWREAAALVGDQPSTLKLILPEVDLAQAATRVPDIHRTMRQYLADGVLKTGVRNGFILTERSTGSGARVGLVGLLDLEKYDYHPGVRTPVRATEGTILERIPPRLTIRRGSALETSHVLMLIDDPMMSVVEPVYDRRKNLTKLYDFPLMMNGGHLTGYAVDNQNDIQSVLDALTVLKARLQGDLFIAVGDGNHSLATAKAYWDEIKRTLPLAEQAEHPARFALVELENIHDDALIFEPIHRVLYGYDGDDLLSEMAAYAAARGWTLAAGAEGQPVDVVFEGKEAKLSIGGSPYALAVGTLQAFLDEWMTGHPETRLDYVHGEAAARALAAGEKVVAFLLPALPKDKLFATVEKLGSLPRKTFSMGEAHEKRYY
ncbi:MAG: DUF1015 domain-containing protein, partial [Eubacteriales bacterium]|nr:DUF1015 domain-containing protein [Eubacteriales bacterium]